MPRPTVPPRGVFVPASIAYAKDIAPAARDTWIQLLGLAWGSKAVNGEVDTSAISVYEIAQITGKSPSTIYGHLAYLRDWGALRWRPSDGKTIIVTLIVGEQASEIQSDSRNLEKPVNTPPTPLMNPDALIDRDNDSKINVMEDGCIRPFQNSGTFQNSGKRTIANKPPKSDPRSKHPAILCVKGITSRFPPKELYDDIIRTLGESPQGATLAACRKEWVKRGYNPNGWDWLFDWYVNGIKARNQVVRKPDPPGESPVEKALREARAREAANGNRR